MLQRVGNQKGQEKKREKETKKAKVANVQFNHSNFRSNKHPKPVQSALADPSLHPNAGKESGRAFISRNQKHLRPKGVDVSELATKKAYRKLQNQALQEKRFVL